MANNPVISGNSGDIYHTNGTISAQEGLISYANNEIRSARGAKYRFRTLDVESAALSGATANIGTNSIAAGWLVFGVLVYVTTLITASGGGASFTVGDGTTAAKWGTGLAFAVGTATTFADFVAATTVATSTPLFYKSAANIVLTVNTGAFTAGKVRASILYMDSTALLS